MPRVPHSTLRVSGKVCVTNTAGIRSASPVMLARRLVEAGVRCVLIDHTNWDTHYANFSVLKDDLLPHLDSRHEHARSGTCTTADCWKRLWCW
jgi:hypothetical protein